MTTKEDRRKKWLEKFRKNRTTKSELLYILQTYKEERKGKKKFLVLCHGHKHKKQFPHALLLDYSIDTDPDIVLDIWSKRDMNMFPANFFDVIVMEYCPIIGWSEVYTNDIIQEFQVIYHNCRKMLKENGEIRINNLLELYCYFMIEEDYDEISEERKEIIISEVLRSLKKIGFINSGYIQRWKNQYVIKIKK